MSPASPLVSVILPTHNRARLLPRAIASVLGQTYKQLELIVVDDASTDDTPAVLERFAADPRLQVLRLDQNGRAARARNLGLRQARGTLVAFQDDDDIWLVEKLEQQVRHLRDGPADVGLSLCGHIRQWNDYSDYVGGERYLRDLVFDRGYDRSRDYSLVATPGWLLRRELLDRVGGFDERMRCWDDWELAYRLSRVCRFAHVDAPLWLAEKRRIAGGGMWDDDRHFGNDYRVLVDKHGGDWNRRARSRQLYLAGRQEALAGATERARECLQQAVRANPLNLKALLAWALTRAGAAATGRVLRSVGAVKIWLRAAVRVR